MKKKIFMVLSAVAVLAMGVLVVACSKDSNALHPNEEIVVEEVAPAPTLQKTSSAAEWEAFNLEIEKLNEKYKVDYSTAMRASGNVTTEKVMEVLLADADGAVDGLSNAFDYLDEFGLLAACAPTPLTWEALLAYFGGSAVIFAAIASWNAASECSLDGENVSINDFSSMLRFDKNFVTIEMGKRHNQLIENLHRDNQGFTGLSKRQVRIEMLNRYEQLYGPVDSNLRQALLSYTLVLPTYIVKENVRNANIQFRNVTRSFSMLQMQRYTEEYLDVVNRSSIDAEDKLLVAVYGSVMCCSKALWNVQ